MSGKLLPQEPGRVFWFLFALTSLTYVGMQVTGSALVNDVSPGGIVTFELIGTMVGSQSIMNAWQGPTMTWVGMNMGLDFLFLVLYSLTISLGCVILAKKLPEKMQKLKRVGKGLSRIIFLAAGLDVVENLALMALLTGSQNEYLPVLARWCAIPKFALVLIALFYVLGAGITILVKPKELSGGTA